LKFLIFLRKLRRNASVDTDNPGLIQAFGVLSDIFLIVQPDLLLNLNRTRKSSGFDVLLYHIGHAAQNTEI
jgi:hypothetical protein